MNDKTDETIVVTNQNDLENTPAVPHDVSIHRIVEEKEDNDLARALKQRHIQMIALAGAIVSAIPPPAQKFPFINFFARAQVSSSLLAVPSRRAALSARSWATCSSALWSAPCNLL
jgi:hypothetical protein